jgi:hypothetical protein
MTHMSIDSLLIISDNLTDRLHGDRTLMFSSACLLSDLCKETYVVFAIHVVSKA